MRFVRRRHDRIRTKSGKRHNYDGKYRWLRYILPIAGLVSLVWFLIRVIPKPSRALYPCQRAAFPLASGFVAWLLGLGASMIAFRKAKLNFAKSRYFIGFVCIVMSIGFVWMVIATTNLRPALAQRQPANKPVGEGKGIYPGRVVWAHDPNSTDSC